MREKNVSQKDLALLLALSGQEVASTDWQLENLRCITPRAMPKYKKVQRLLDLDHDSSINESYEAFWVMDSQIDIRKIDK